MFGNRTGRGYLDELWSFDLNTLRTQPKWELIKPSSQKQPSARNSCTLVPYQNQLILFGGCGFSGYLGDVWSFNLKSRQWSKLACTGDIPSTRSNHAVALLDDVMYAIGGYVGGRVSPDGSALRIPDKRWFKLSTTTPSLWSQCHVTTNLTGTKIFFFGGGDSMAPSGDSVHILDAKYINNPQLHSNERLMELNILSQVMQTRERLESGVREFGIVELEKRVKELEHDIGELRRGQVLSYISESPLKTDSLARLKGTDAQIMADFLAEVLGSRDLQSNSDRRRILHLLAKLAKSAQVFPKRAELSDVRCDLTNPINDEGGYGFIYKGVFKEQEICVKAVRVLESGTKEATKILRAQAGELALLTHVSHPNVIPLYGAYLSNETRPRICVVSPWMENGDLANYLMKFPNTPIIPLISDLAAGLMFLHDMGIVHADLKARNILISQSHRAMLADFGVSTVLNTSVGTTTSQDFAGTIFWMAPELLVPDDEGELSPPSQQSDMWGFACVCYEALTGQIPFNQFYKPSQMAGVFIKSQPNPLRPKRDGNPTVVDGGPLMTLAEKCWNYDPSHRPTAAEALQFLNELNVQDDRPSMDEELAMFKAVKSSQVEVKIDYVRVLSIVRKK